MSDKMNDLEQSLAGLKPATSSVSRDAILFEAGRRSVRRGPGWLGLPLAAILGVGIGINVPRNKEPAIVQAPPTPILQNIEPSTTPSFWRMQHEAIEAGDPFVAFAPLPTLVSSDVPMKTNRLDLFEN